MVGIAAAVAGQREGDHSLLGDLVLCRNQNIGIHPTVLHMLVRHLQVVVARNRYLGCQRGINHLWTTVCRLSHDAGLDGVLAADRIQRIAILLVDAHLQLVGLLVVSALAGSSATDQRRSSALRRFGTFLLFLLPCHRSGSAT